MWLRINFRFHKNRFTMRGSQFYIYHSVILCYQSSFMSHIIWVIPYDSYDSQYLTWKIGHQSRWQHSRLAPSQFVIYLHMFSTFVFDFLKSQNFESSKIHLKISKFSYSKISIKNGSSPFDICFRQSAWIWLQSLTACEWFISIAWRIDESSSSIRLK